MLQTLGRCHSERSEESPQFPISFGPTTFEQLHRSFALLRMTRTKIHQILWRGGLYAQARASG